MVLLPSRKLRKWEKQWTIIKCQSLFSRNPRRGRDLQTAMTAGLVHLINSYTCIPFPLVPTRFQSISLSYSQKNNFFLFVSSLVQAKFAIFFCLFLGASTRNVSANFHGIIEFRFIFTKSPSNTCYDQGIQRQQVSQVSQKHLFKNF